MKKLTYGVATALSLVLVACGSSSSSDGGTDAGTVDAGTADAGTPGDAGPMAGYINISGVAAVHPLSEAIDAAVSGGVAFTGVEVGIVNPLTFLAEGPTATPLAGASLNTASSNCPTSTSLGESACAWSFSNVDINGATLGLAAIVQGSSASSAWIPTGTGFASGATVTAETTSGTPITTVTAFGVSTATEAALVQFVDAVNASANLAAGGLTAQGFMIGTVLDATGAPFAGATVTASGSYTIFYLNQGASGLTPGTATDATGLFLAVPSTALTGGAASSNTATFTVTGTGHTWSPTLAGSATGTCFVLLFLASS